MDAADAGNYHFTVPYRGAYVPVDAGGGDLEPLEVGRVSERKVWSVSAVLIPPGGLGTIVDQAEKKERRRKQTNAGKTMTQATGTRQGASLSTEEGLSPNLQAHIGRHLRAVFDEVAREPIPDRLLQLLKDLERSGDK